MWSEDDGQQTEEQRERPLDEEEKEEEEEEEGEEVREEEDLAWYDEVDELLTERCVCVDVDDVDDESDYVSGRHGRCECECRHHRGRDRAGSAGGSTAAEDHTCLNDTCFCYATMKECCDDGVCGNRRLQRKRARERHRRQNGKNQTAGVRRAVIEGADGVLLRVFRAGDKGWGLKTVHAITGGPSEGGGGRFVDEYLGEIVSDEEYNRRVTQLVEKLQQEKRPHSRGAPQPQKSTAGLLAWLRHMFVMELSAGRMIDARHKGGVTRFLNHSCDPNCTMQVWTVKGRLRIGVFTLREIRAGEELTLDYEWEPTPGKPPTRCLCGSARCRGTLEVSTVESRQDALRRRVRNGRWRQPRAPSLSNGMGRPASGASVGDAGAGTETEAEVEAEVQQVAAESDSGAALVSRLIKVWWANNQQYFVAEVVAFDDSTSEYSVQYLIDDERETLDLSTQKWLILDEDQAQVMIAKKQRSTSRQTSLGSHASQGGDPPPMLSAAATGLGTTGLTGPSATVRTDFVWHFGPARLNGYAAVQRGELQRRVLALQPGVQDTYHTGMECLPVVASSSPRDRPPASAVIRLTASSHEQIALVCALLTRERQSWLNGLETAAAQSAAQQAASRAEDARMRQSWTLGIEWEGPQAAGCGDRASAGAAAGATGAGADSAQATATEAVDVAIMCCQLRGALRSMRVSASCTMHACILLTRVWRLTDGDTTQALEIRSDRTLLLTACAGVAMKCRGDFHYSKLKRLFSEVSSQLFGRRMEKSVNVDALLGRYGGFECALLRTLHFDVFVPDPDALLVNLLPQTMVQALRAMLIRAMVDAATTGAFVSFPTHVAAAAAVLCALAIRMFALQHPDLASARMSERGSGTAGGVESDLVEGFLAVQQSVRALERSGDGRPEDVVLSMMDACVHHILAGAVSTMNSPKFLCPKSRYHGPRETPMWLAQRLPSGGGGGGGGGGPVGMGVQAVTQAIGGTLVNMGAFPPLYEFQRMGFPLGCLAQLLACWKASPPTGGPSEVEVDQESSSGIPRGPKRAQLSTMLTDGASTWSSGSSGSTATAGTVTGSDVDEPSQLAAQALRMRCSSGRQMAATLAAPAILMLHASDITAQQNAPSASSTAGDVWTVTLGLQSVQALNLGHIARQLQLAQASVDEFLAPTQSLVCTSRPWPTQKQLEREHRSLERQLAKSAAQAGKAAAASQKQPLQDAAVFGFSAQALRELCLALHVHVFSQESRAVDWSRSSGTTHPFCGRGNPFVLLPVAIARTPEQPQQPQQPQQQLLSPQAMSGNLCLSQLQRAVRARRAAAAAGGSNATTAERCLSPELCTWLLHDVGHLLVSLQTAGVFPYSLDPSALWVTRSGVWQLLSLAYTHLARDFGERDLRSELACAWSPLAGQQGERSHAISGSAAGRTGGAAAALAALRSLHLNGGALPYTPPEVLLGGSPGPAAASWVFGVLLHIVTFGKPPFAGADESKQLEYVFRVCGDLRQCASTCPLLHLPLASEAAAKKGCRRTLEKHVAKECLAASVEPPTSVRTVLSGLLELDPDRRLPLVSAMTQLDCWSVRLDRRQLPHLLQVFVDGGGGPTDAGAWAGTGTGEAQGAAVAQQTAVAAATGPRW